MPDAAVSVVVIEDDPQIRRFVRATLHAHGMTAIEADTAAAGLREAATRKPDLIVIDLGLPDADGIDVIRELRGWTRTPVIVLSARTSEQTKVAALDAGADDYLIKPFDLDELAARVRALLRRRTGQKQPIYAHGELTLDPAAHEVTKDGELLPLVPREFALLQALIEEPTRVFTKAELEEKLYGWGEEVGSNTIEVHVHSLRRKIGADQVVTVRGVGYRLKRC